ncbi:MAG: EamA family transporter [Kineosporiaceae bacterium]|nr:EamA family transporter [Aeromicrobium sp.]
MSNRDRFLAILVAVIWGINFPAIATALDHFSPLFLVALRFGFLAVPAILFVPRPKVRLRWLIGYGLGFGTLQFVGLFVGIREGLPSGLASVVLQASAPMTVVLAGFWLGERITRRQTIGILIAASGLALIAIHRSQTAAMLPVLLVLLGAFGWAIGNICSREARPENPLHFMMWMSVIPPVPMFALALLVEGPDSIWKQVRTMGTAEAFPSMIGLAYVVLLATVVGAGIWTTLLKAHPASSVAPFSMLVPVTGLLSAWILLGEVAEPIELAGSAITVCGVLSASIGRRPAAVAEPRA